MIIRKSWAFIFNEEKEWSYRSELWDKISVGLFLLVIGLFLLLVYCINFIFSKYLFQNKKLLEIILMPEQIILLIIFFLFILGTFNLVGGYLRSKYSEKKSPKNKLTKNKSDELKVLLTEYRVCQMNKDHYDGVRWTMASIFIGASFALLGFSFTEDIVGDKNAVSFMALFSLAMFLIWVAYNQHTQPWIHTSNDRQHEIEQRLQKSNYDIKLHTLIKAKKQIPGVWIFFLMILTIFLAWSFRIALLYP